VILKIRSRNDFRYKYGCLEISQRDATERRKIYCREKKKFESEERIREEVLRDCYIVFQFGVASFQDE